MARLGSMLLSSPCSPLLGAKGTDPWCGATCLGRLRASQATVYDFWTTRCTNCPAALDSLDEMAQQRPYVTFVSVNIDDASAAEELVKTAASERRWTRLTHAHLDEHVKENVKDMLGMRTVPFYVVVDKDGAILRHGNAKSLPLKSVEVLDAVLSSGQKENDPRIANTLPSLEIDTPAVTSSSVQCEGGACKLVRTIKLVAPPTSATVGGMECEGGMCRLARKNKPGAPSPAISTDGVGCDGGVCKLVHKENTTDSTEAPTLAGSTGGMDCVGGVCKLARKKQTQDAEMLASDDGKKPSEPAKAGVTENNEDGDAATAVEGQLGVGCVMPALRVEYIDGGQVTTLDGIRAGGSAVLEFWTTRCVGCPAALDALQELALAGSTAAVGGSSQHKSATGCKYVAVNLDNLEMAATMVSQGRWPSLKHVFAGHPEDTDCLAKFKISAGLKSVPFYVVVGNDGIIEQIGGPKTINLGKTARQQTETSPNNVSAGGVTKPLVAATVFTIDEDF